MLSIFRTGGFIGFCDLLKLLLQSEIITDVEGTHFM